MSLFNRDKESIRRLTPQVDSVDKLLSRKAHATDSIAPRAVGATGGRIVTKDDSITVYDESNQRIVIGRLPDGSYGIIVSKPGIDVNDVFV